jgi:hypothetical protein
MFTYKRDRARYLSDHKYCALGCKNQQPQTFRKYYHGYSSKWVGIFAFLITTALHRYSNLPRRATTYKKLHMWYRVYLKIPFLFKAFFLIPVNKYGDVTIASFQVPSHLSFVVRPTGDVTSNSEILTALKICRQNRDCCSCGSCVAFNEVNRNHGYIRIPIYYMLFLLHFPWDCYIQKATKPTCCAKIISFVCA